MSMTFQRCVCLSVLFVCIIALSNVSLAQAQNAPKIYAGRNINMVSGTRLPINTGDPIQREALGGDPYLQRQNEPSLAVSSRNPMHLLAGANDYRTVDIPVSTPDIVGDAWLGLFKSFDGGRTWQSTLLPGYPQAQNEQEGINSPIHYSQDTSLPPGTVKCCEAAADPTVRAGTNGMFYYSGMAFNRGKKHESRLFVSRFIDLNNREGAYFDVPANKDPIKFIDTQVVNKGTPGQFKDKPWLAVDIPRSGAKTIKLSIDDYASTQDSAIQANGQGKTTVTQEFACGNIYLAYAVFLGNPETNPHTKVEVVRSIDCGTTWEKKVKVSAGYQLNQGVSLAVDPQNGEVYVAWQVFDSNNQKPQVVVAKSIDGGQNFGSPIKVAETLPFNQGMRPADSGDPFRLFRTNAYPTLAVDDSNRVYIAWSERGIWGGDNLQDNVVPGDGIVDGSRIKFSYSDDGGTNWKPPALVDSSDLTESCYPKSDESEASVSDQSICHAGHQIMPSLSYGGGKLTLLFYDFRDDYYPRLYDAVLGKADCSVLTGPEKIKCEEVQASIPFDTSLPPADAVAFEPYPVRHTVDARVAVADVTGGSVVFSEPSLPVSKYLSSIMPDSSGTLKLVQLQSNQVNLPLFLEGTRPFIGDYIDIAAASRLVPDEANPGEWKYNLNTEDASIYHAVWTDNRDVMPPPAKINADNTLERPEWTKYEKPSDTQCSDDYWPGMRNQNIYTSRITQGLVMGSYGNSKPINIERAFSIFVENTIPEFDPNYLPLSRSLLLTLDAPDSVKVCFDPLTAAGVCPKTDSQGKPYELADVYSLSKIALTVFAEPVSPDDSDYDPNVAIKVTAKEIEWVGGSYAIKSDGLRSSLMLNPDPTNPSPLNEDEAGNNLSDSETHKPAFVPFSCADFATLPAEINSNCESSIESVSSLLIEWPKLINPANPALLNPALLNTTANPALLNPALLNPALLNPALLNPALLNPALLNNPSTPALLNPALLNPALLNPALLNPALLNPALLNPALLNPALLNPALLNEPSTPALLNPALLNPALLNPALLNDPLPDELNSTPGTGDPLNLSAIPKSTLLIQGTDLDPADPGKTPATLTDLTWRVKNIGNNESSYLFSWYSNLNLQQNPKQILIYRTYKTPSVDINSCLLNEAGLHYEFLVNVLNANLLNPALLNRALSFSMAPSSPPGGAEEDYVYITLRFLDDDGQGGDDAVDPDQVAVSAEPEAPPVVSSMPADPPTSTVLFASPNPSVYGQPVTLTASVNSAAGNPTFGQVSFLDGSAAPENVNLSVSNAAVLSKSDLTAGSHTITAKYSGVTGLFGESSSGPVIQHVKQAGQTISFGPLPNKSMGDPPFTVFATATSGLEPSYTAGPAAVCSSSGDTITINGVGTCEVTASQAGNGNYLPAYSVARPFTVSSGP